MMHLTTTYTPLFKTLDPSLDSRQPSENAKFDFFLHYFLLQKIGRAVLLLQIAPAAGQDVSNNDDDHHAHCQQSRMFLTPWIPIGNLWGYFGNCV